MKEFQDKLQFLKDNLNKKEQSYLCLRSIENFLLYFDQLQQYKIKVEQLLIDYFNSIDEILNNGDIINFETCKFLVRDYILSIGRCYRIEEDFKLRSSLSGVLFWGLQIDILLLIFKLLKEVNYIPMTTLFFLVWWIYQQIFFTRKHKVYGVKY